MLLPVLFGVNLVDDSDDLTLTSVIMLFIPFGVHS